MDSSSHQQGAQQIANKGRNKSLNIGMRTGPGEHTDSLLVSKCGLDSTEYDLIAFRVIHLSPFMYDERGVTYMKLSEPRPAVILIKTGSYLIIFPLFN